MTKRRVSPQGGEAVVINRTQRQRSEAVRQLQLKIAVQMVVSLLLLLTITWANAVRQQLYYYYIMTDVLQSKENW